MREIVFDTETTGLDPASGHRLVEIGCVELVGNVPSGRSFHSYLNPERDVPEEAARIHGLSGDFLRDKPVFASVVDDFLEFIAEDPLIIHNAAFDLRFINAELGRLGFSAIPSSRAVDTVQMARKKFPGSPASLDALCRRFNIDTSKRTKHGALLDAELLADVYLELLGGRQVVLTLDSNETVIDVNNSTSPVVRPTLEPRSFPLSPEELAAHTAMLSLLKKPVWNEN
jgi:DNA polymerase III subunit epsilon